MWMYDDLKMLEESFPRGKFSLILIELEKKKKKKEVKCDSEIYKL